MLTIENQYQPIEEFTDKIMDLYNSSGNYSQKEIKSIKIYEAQPNFYESMGDEQIEVYIKKEINEVYIRHTEENEGNKTNSEPNISDKNEDLFLKEPQNQKQININKGDLSTKENSNSNPKRENENSKKDIELIEPILQKKRERTNDSGDRKNTMLNVYKSNLVFDIYKYLFPLFEKTEYYKKNKKNLKKIDKHLYIEQAAEKNLDLLNMKIKELLSTNNENKEIIDIIYDTEDYLPLIEFIEITIKNLTMFYSSNDSIQQENLEDYQLFLLNSYSNLISDLETKRKKSKEYLDTFKKYTKNVYETFSEMKIKSDNRRKKE